MTTKPSLRGDAPCQVVRCKPDVFVVPGEWPCRQFCDGEMQRVEGTKGMIEVVTKDSPVTMATASACPGSSPS